MAAFPRRSRWRVVGSLSSDAVSDEQVIELYQGHGTSEQFHSEFKTDMDIERLPSGKFATNALVLSMAAFAYNILRFIGRLGLLGSVRQCGTRRIAGSRR